MAIFISLIILFSATPAPTLRGALDEALMAREITPAQRLDLLEQSVVAPQNLPARWRSYVPKSSLRRTGTPDLVYVYQQRRALGLLGSPVYLTGNYALESELYPIRVFYSTTSKETMAQATLEAAELAWAREIDEFGFIAPQTRDSDRYNIYLDDCGNAMGYMSPGSSIAETPWDDCTSYVCISTNSPSGYIGLVVAHELSHATQGAMDCLEPIPIWENTSMFMENAVYPGSISSFSGVDNFQGNPSWSLADGAVPFWNEGNAYIYHGFIWLLYVAGTYGEGPEDAPFVRSIWQNAMQETGSNDLDYLQAIDALLARQGASLDEAFMGFCAARYFVDDNFNELHSTMPYAEIINPAPTVTSSLSLDDAVHITSSLSTSPRPYGVNYYKLSHTPGKGRPMEVELRASSDEKWGLAVIPYDHDTVFSTTGTAKPLTLSFDGSLEGTMLLMVMNLGTPSFSANNPPNGGTPYELTLRSSVPLPVISAVTPSSMERGMESLVTIYGSGFQEGAHISIIPEGNLSTGEITFVSDTHLTVRVTAASDALTGPYMVQVTNPDSGTMTFDKGITIIERSADPPPSKGCTTGHAPSSLPWPLGLLLLSLLFVGRHRHTP